MNLVFLETVRASNSNLIFNKDMNVRHRRESEKTLFWIRLWHNIQCLSSDDGNFVLFLLFPINPFKVTYVSRTNIWMKSCRNISTNVCFINNFGFVYCVTFNWLKTFIARNFIRRICTSRNFKYLQYSKIEINLFSACSSRKSSWSHRKKQHANYKTIVNFSWKILVICLQ